jgi:putative transferase (TIGR04331 family)
LKSASLVEFQHGGQYGEPSFVEWFTHIREKDIFYSWGWTDKKMKNVKPLPSSYLSRLMNTYTGRLNKILFVGTRIPRHMYGMEASLYPDYIKVYYQNKRRFLTALKKTLQCRVMYRPHREIGWKEVDYITAIHPTIEIVKKKKLIHWMQKAKVVVVDHPHTSYLESLTINVPSIFYWNHEIYSMNPEAEPYFQGLRDAGILYKDPISAAKKVNEIFDNPMEWWHSNTVQNARKEFCDRFAYARKDWLDVWVKELRKFT